MIEEKKQKVYAVIRISITIIAMTILIIIGVKLMPVIASLTTSEGQIAFENKVVQMGIKGPLYILLIQILQMIVAIIPGEPIEMIASICFGFWGGLILCLVGFFIGSFIIFTIVRKLGMSFIQLFFSKEKIDNIKNKKYFKSARKFEAALFIIFIIPGIPKDIFLYVAGLSPVSLKRFLPLATFARLPALIISNFAGSKISEGNIWSAILLYASTLIFGTSVLYISSKLNKNKQKENIL